MRCPEAELISGLFDGELDEAATALVEQHLGACNACRGKFERLERLRSVLGTKGVRLKASAQLHQKIAATVSSNASEQEQRSRVR